LTPPLRFPLSLHFGTLAVGLGSFPLDCETHLPQSDCQSTPSGIRSLVGLGNLSGPQVHPVLYLRRVPSDASPKAISGRTSYLPVRLAFHPYPQLIPSFCNRNGFGPPPAVMRASPCPWVAHQVSCLICAMTIQSIVCALFRLAFAPAPAVTALAPRHT
jgi:hypothetical protein